MEIPTKYIEKTFTIKVTGINNHLPVIENASKSISETTAISSEVHDINDGSDDTDKDGDPIKYVITAGNTNADFAIDAATGKITVAKALDFETTTQYLFNC